MKNFVLIVLAVLIMSSCFSSSKNKVEIFSLKNINSSGSWDASNTTMYWQINNYLVTGYTDDKLTEAILDSFAQHYVDSNALKFSTYNFSIKFYRESAKTNLKTVAADPKIIDDYSHFHDLAYVSLWSSITGFKKERWEGGYPIDDDPNPPRVEIREIDSTKKY